MPLFSPTQKFALEAENHVVQWLQSHHIEVYQPDNFNLGYDALLEAFVQAEIKASRCYSQHNGKGYSRLRWQFFIDKPLPDHGLVILACYAPDDVYLYCIPTWFLKLRQTHSITITSHPLRYNGWLKQFLFSIKTVYSVLYQAKRFSPLWVSFLD